MRSAEAHGVRVAAWITATAAALLLAGGAPAGPAAGPADARGPRQGAPGQGPWPQTVSANGRSYTVFAPEFRSYAGNVATFTQPVSVVPPPGEAAIAVMGSISVTARAAPGADDGELELHSFSVDSFTIGGNDAGPADLAALQAALGGKAIGITRRALLHDMQVENARDASTPDLGDLLPAIRTERGRAVLLQVHGEPRFRRIGETGWSRARNTPFILLQSPEGNAVARLGAGRWVSAPGIGGPFAPCDAPPAAIVASLGAMPSPSDGEVPPAGAAARDARPLPKLVVATEPTVLLWTDGEPQLAAVAPGVEWATNAGSTLLRTADPGAWWLLAAGRWFRAASLDGPWARAAPSDLPRAFALLPGGPRFDAAKASVPGTPEAVNAVAAAGEARSVRIRRDAATCTVSWSGAPAWLDIPGTGMRGSANASQPVLECRRSFYCCDGAVWFRADSPAGPWSACDDLPGEFRSIPAASPFFPLTGVLVVGADPGTVTYAYTPAYLGTCVDDGTVVFGAGWEVPWVPLGEDQFAMVPQPYPMALAFDADTGTFAPDSSRADPDMQPALAPDAFVAGWPGWGWCSGWSSAWAWGWTRPGAWDEWDDWWRRWNPYWNRWANARTAEQRRRDDAAAAELAAREAQQAEEDRAADERAADERRAMAAQEAEWRERQAADAAAAREAQADREARADAARFADRRATAAREAQAAARPAGPTAPRGSVDWWYEFYNDYSNGYLSRATGYRDPRYAPGAWGTIGPR